MALSDETVIGSPARLLDSYVGELARRVEDALGERLVGVWLVGSAALEDYDPRRSDVDVQAVATERLSLSERRGLAARLEHGTLANPARGLEFVLYAEEDLAAPGGPRFQLNLNTGPRLAHHVTYDADDDPRFWFTIDVSIARQGGRALVGPPASVVFPEPPRPLLATAVLEALDFYADAPDAMNQALPDQASTDQALLSACRAWAWVGRRGVAIQGRQRPMGDTAATGPLPDPAGAEATGRESGGPTHAERRRPDAGVGAGRSRGGRRRTPVNVRR
jgi:hypothetical protein